MTKTSKATLILYIIIATAALACGTFLFLGPAFSPHTFTNLRLAKKAAYYGVATVLTVTGYVSIRSNARRLTTHCRHGAPNKLH